MEPKFVYRYLAGQTLVADLQRTLKELYHTKIDLSESFSGGSAFPHRFRAGAMRSSPGHSRKTRPPRLLLDQPVCPLCNKVKVPRALVVSSQEMQEKQCICTAYDSPRHVKPPLTVLHTEVGTIKRQRRGNTESSLQKNPSDKSLSKGQINTAVLKLLPLNPSQLRLVSVLRPRLGEASRISTSPKPGSKEEESDLMPTVLEHSVTTQSDERRRYVIYPGNNSKLVGRLMLRRKEWVEGKTTDTFAHFSWHPTSRTVRFDRLVPYLGLQIVNHFELHSELSNKLNLFHNLQRHCNLSGLNILELMPLTFSIEFESTHFHAQYNAFTNFFKALAESGKKENRDRTACLPPTHNSGGNVWLLKPSGFNRGRGIYVFSSLEEFKEILDEYHEVARVNPRQERVKVRPELVKLPSLKFVIQKYIERPFLINTRKFDIRMWALVTQDMQGYLYREGYLRTSSEPFTLDKEQLRSQYIHLTNNAVQKQGSQYGKFEDGNQLSFSLFQSYLDACAKGKSIREDFIPKIKSLAHAKLNPLKRTVCFELFGYDFIVDEDMGIWLIEVNTNPCLELSSPLLEQLIPSMLDDMLKLTVDRVFSTEYEEELIVPHVVELPGRNNWEHIVNLLHKGV